MPYSLESKLFSEPVRARLGVTGLFLLLLAGCGEADSQRDIQETRRVRSGPADLQGASNSAHRFGFENPPRPDAPQGGGKFEWQLPAGWRDLPSTPMRTANFDVAPDVECYLTVLPGGGGGLGANLNRWRRQMSLAPLTEAEIAALPLRTVLGNQARFIECEGTYVGMDGNVQRPRFLLMGIALEHDGRGIFLKMVGPADVVRGQSAAFAALCTSLRESAGDTAAPAKAPSGGQEPDAADAGGLKWTAPPGWNRGPARPMRLVTFTLGAETECYVTVLEGMAGGLEANVNRWRDQMGQPPLDPAAIAALPSVPMLGRMGKIVQIRGDFTGMDATTRSGSMLIGAVCEMGDSSLFVKMTGPEAEVRIEQARFEAFCRSLR